MNRQLAENQATDHQNRPSPRATRGLATTLLVTLAVLCFVGHGTAENLTSEFQSEFIRRFPKFIEWPAESIDQSFVIGVMGRSDLLPALTKAMVGSNIKGKPVDVRRVSDLPGLDSCNIVFVSSSKRGQLEEILSRVKRKPILTISDTKGFGRRGVIINFTIQDDAIRFEINKNSAEDAGLRLAAQLIALGDVI